MRKNTIMLLILGLVLMPLSLAEEWPICFDFQAPDAPTGLTINGNVNLDWTASVDGPANCSSGVDYYIIYRDDVLIKTTSSTSYKDSRLSPGTYNYKVTAVDTVGNGEGPAATGSVTIARSSGGGGGSSGSTTSAAENWNCGNWSACVNGTQTQTCTHKIMSGTTKTNTQNCTVQIIQQTTVQNQTQNQTGPEIIMINQTEDQAEPAENLTGHNIIIINIPMRMVKEKEEITETIATEEATKTILSEKGNAIEQDDSATGAAVGAGMSKIPWALIILCAGLTGAAIILGIIMKRPAKEERKPAKEEKEEKLMELEVPGAASELEVPTPFGLAKEEKEERWIELNEIPAPYRHAQEKKEEKWIEIKVRRKRTQSVKKALAAMPVKKKMPEKKLVPKKTPVKRKR